MLFLAQLAHEPTSFFASTASRLPKSDRSHEPFAIPSLVKRFLRNVCDIRVMSEPTNPAEDDETHWKPIVEKLRAELNGTARYIFRNTNVLRDSKMSSIRAATTVLRDADVVENLDHGWGDETPNTASSAGVLRQALHAMRERFKLLCPESALPEEGSEVFFSRNLQEPGQKSWRREF